MVINLGRDHFLVIVILSGNTCSATQLALAKLHPDPHSNIIHSDLALTLMEDEERVV